MLTDLDTILSRASSMDSSDDRPSEYEDDEEYPSTDPCLIEESQAIDARADADEKDRSCVEFVSFGMVFFVVRCHREIYVKLNEIPVCRRFSGYMPTGRPRLRPSRYLE